MQILIVDDEPVHRNIAKRAIQKTLEQAKILEASDLEQAIQICKTIQPDSFLVLDMNLGSICGLDLLKTIEPKKFRGIVVVSTSDEQSDMRAGYAAGANCYLIKSSEPSLFQTHLGQALRFLERIRI